jgi:hypothetical protein
MSSGMENVPIFDETGYTYCKAHMQAYLESINPNVWTMTNEGYEISDVHVVELGKAKNILFEGITKDGFAHIHSKGHIRFGHVYVAFMTHEGSSDIKEEKYYAMRF